MGQRLGHTLWVNRIGFSVNLVGAMCLFGIVVTGCQGRRRGAATTSGGGDAVNKAAQGSVEDLTIVVEADKSRIVQEEAAVNAGKQDVEAQRTRLQKERAEIAERLNSLSKQDQAVRQQLEAKQQELLDHERALRGRAEHFEDARTQLDADKNALLARISKLTAVAAPGAGHSLQTQEEELVRRAAVLAAREKAVAAREAIAATALVDLKQVMDEVRQDAAAFKDVKQLTDEMRQSIMTLRTAPLPPTPSSVGATAPATRTSLGRALRAVRLRMQSKGILLEDLPEPMQSFATAAQVATAPRDIAVAQALCERVTQAVDAMSINHSFVEAKMARINRTLDNRGLRLDVATQKRLQDLLAEATDAFSDGRYDRANKKINQMCALLPGSHAQ